MGTWSVLRYFVIFYEHLLLFEVYFSAFWYFVPRKIWQPCSSRGFFVNFARRKKLTKRLISGKMAEVAKRSFYLFFCSLCGFPLDVRLAFVSLSSALTRVARFFFEQFTNTGKMYLITTKYTKCP
jgi:hypothetical protein